jgi:basic membrane protein A and related proteins
MRRALKHGFITFAVVSLLAVAVGCGDDAEPAAGGGGGGAKKAEGEANEKITVALVETGPKEDGGWNSNYLRGIDTLQSELPNVEATIVADVNPGAQGQETFASLAAKGTRVLIANGNFAADVRKVAPDYPDTIFLGVRDDKTLENVGIYGAADEEGGYLNGILAGSTTKSGVLGYVGSYPLPAVKRVLNAFLVGARSVRPDATLKVVYVNSFYDPTKERQAAVALADAGADVLMQDNSSPASASVAEQRGLKYVGWAGDRRKQAPNAWLGGFNYGWGAYFVSAVKAVQEGTWEAAIDHPGVSEGVIEVFPFGSDLPDDVVAKVEEARDALASGELSVFAGPIKDVNGKVVVPDGSTISDDVELHNCCAWVVDGVSGGEG